MKHTLPPLTYMRKDIEILTKENEQLRDELGRKTTYADELNKMVENLQSQLNESTYGTEYSKKRLVFLVDQAITVARRIEASGKGL